MIVDIDNLGSLPLSKRLHLLEMLMDTFTNDQDSFASPAWHLEELSKRQSELDDPSTWISLEDVKRSLMS